MSMEKRITINFGYSWIKYIFLVIAFFVLLEIIDTSENRVYNFLYLFIFIGLFLLFRLARKIQYDSQNLYIIRANKKRIIPLSTIKSIKKSRSKVNGSRFWILIYTNEMGEEKKIRYFMSFLYTDFNNKVKQANPAVIIWTHPFFNH